MKLQEVFDQLRTGELSLLSIGGQNQGVINEKNQEVLLNALNLGLANLHTRFNLREGKLKLLLIPDNYLYTLRKEFALENDESNEPIRYIEGEFIDDLAKVEQVWTEEGEELPLNNKAKYACSTPKSNVLRVPAPIVDQDLELPEKYKTNALDVVYRQLHPKVGLDEFGELDLETAEVDIPYSHLEALLYFIAARVHHPVGMVGDFQMGASYAAKYEQACQRLENQGLDINRGQENTRLERNGWV